MNSTVLRASSSSDERLHLGLERVDRGHDRSEAADLLALACPKDLCEHAHDRTLYAAAPTPPVRPWQCGFSQPPSGRRPAACFSRRPRGSVPGVRASRDGLRPRRGRRRGGGGRRARCSTVANVPGSSVAPAGGAKCTSLPWRVRPESTPGSFLEGPSTTASSITADAGPVAGERGALDHDLEPFEPVGDLVGRHEEVGHLRRHGCPASGEKMNV